MLNAGTEPAVSARRGHLRVYDEAVRQALVVFWEASDRVCGKRLKALLPVLMPALERHGHVALDAAVRDHVLKVSAATIDRILSGPRASAGGRRARAKTRPAVRRRVPVRTFADWHDPAPGFVEADLVVHCGESMAGSFACTLVLTDIASAWTECVPLLVREGSLIVEAFERLRVTLPFPLRGIDTDNGDIGLQKAQQLLDKLERTPRVHGAFAVVGRIVKDGELLGTIVFDGLEFLPENLDRRGNERVLMT